MLTHSDLIIHVLAKCNNIDLQIWYSIPKKRMCSMLTHTDLIIHVLAKCNEKSQ